MDRGFPASGAQERRPGPLRRMIVPLAVVLVLVTAGFAHAVHDTGVFELDGNAAVDSPPREDFDTIFTGPGSSTDRAFVSDSALPDQTIQEGGDKDFHPLSAWGCVSKNNPVGKLDIRRAYAASYVIGGDIHVVFGLNRETNEGDASVGFWFFQQPVSCHPVATGGSFTGQKIDGDLLVVSEFSNGGTVQTVDLYRWTDPTPAAPESGDETLVLLTSGTDCKATPDPPGHHAVNADVCGTQNTAPIAVAWEAAPLDEFKYFEGGLNLTKLFAQFFPRDVCYVSFQAKSRSSTSLDADLEDFAQGTLNTCQRVTVAKSTNPAGSAQTFPFTVSGGPDGLSDAFILGDGDVHETTGVRPGVYQITETVPAGWEATATCSGGPFGAGGPYTNGADFVLGPGQSVSCQFHNTAPPRITVDKVTDPPGDPTFFSFTTAGGAVSDAFTLADASGSHTTEDLPAGTSTVTETVPAGWVLSATCSGGPFGAGAGYTNGAPMTLVAGDEVTCVFTNTNLAANGIGAITVDKVTSPANDPTLFTVTVAEMGGPAVETYQISDASPARTTSNLAPGTYTITETVPAGWDLTITCSGGPFGAGGPMTTAIRS